MGVEDGEVGGEHGGGDFAAVGAVADEGVDEARGFCGLDCGVKGGGQSGRWYEQIGGGGDRGQIIG